MLNIHFDFIVVFMVVFCHFYATVDCLIFSYGQTCSGVLLFPVIFTSVSCSVLKKGTFGMSCVSTSCWMQETQQPLLDRSVSCTQRPVFIVIIIITTLATSNNSDASAKRLNFIMITVRQIWRLESNWLHATSQRRCSTPTRQASHRSR